MRWTASPSALRCSASRRRPPEVNRILARIDRVQHWLVAILSVWLILTSPWIGMRRIVPDSAKFLDYAHVGLGLMLTALAVTYLLTNLMDGRWRQHFPWAAGNLAEVRKDLGVVARGRIPSSGGAGLFSLIQGLLLIALLVTALTGFGWLLADGARIALAWREWHVVSADCFAWLLVVHVLGSALHLLDLLFD